MVIYFVGACIARPYVRIQQDYSELPRTIIISIVAFELFSCKEFHSEFQALEVTRHTPLTDKMSLHYFELSKLSERINTDCGNELWLKLLKLAEKQQATAEAAATTKTTTAEEQIKSANDLKSQAAEEMDRAKALYAGQLSLNNLYRQAVTATQLRQIQQIGLQHKSQS